MNWLNIDTFLEHGELGIMTLVILLAAFLIFKAMKELGRREERAIEAIVNNTKAMQGVKSIAKEIKDAVGFCPRRLRIELEQAEIGAILTGGSGKKSKEEELKKV